MSDLYHLSDGGKLQSQGLQNYGYFDIEVFVCPVCSTELDAANDGNYIGTLAEYEYFKSKGWKSEHGKPRRLYPEYPHE